MNRTPSRSPDQVSGLGPRWSVNITTRTSASLRGFQNFGASAPGVVGVLGVDVEDGPEVLINAGRRRCVRANFHPFDTLGVHGFQMCGFQALNGRAGEEEGSENKEAEEPHTFILRG